MSDPFALLGLPRRPWLDESAIRAAFQQRARQSHPDMEGGHADQFAALNAAQTMLADTSSRLQILAGDALAPPGLPHAEFGFRLGMGLREADVVSSKLAAARSPLDRALLASEAAVQRKAVRLLEGELAGYARLADDKLRELDAAWPEVDLGQVAALGAEFRFLHRWRAQIRQRELALSI